jgi:putative FmdB family regulatory protein
MPTYDYECIKCGYAFEEDLKIADRKIPTEERCRFPTCGGKVKQVIVKASGFAYDNIKTKHSVKPAAVGQLEDRLKDIKSRMPGNTL